MSVSFENIFCERDECHHNVPAHPNDGPCTKCTCVGFYSSSQYYDPLREYYGRKIIDVHVDFVSELDVGKYLLCSFPAMSKKFVMEKKAHIDKFWTDLARDKPELAKSVNQKIDLYNKLGKSAVEGNLTSEESKIIIKLCHDEAVRDGSIDLLKSMTLSSFTTGFREFIRAILIIIYKIEIKHMKKQTFDQVYINKKCSKISELDIKKMATKFYKQWGLNLEQELDYEQFVEFFYRRNIFVHNKGLPDEQYRKKTGYSGPNSKLELTNVYLSELISVLRRYSDLIYDYFLEKELGLINITKKGNAHHIDLTKKGNAWQMALTKKGNVWQMALTKNANLDK